MIFIKYAFVTVFNSHVGVVSIDIFVMPLRDGMELLYL